MQYRKQSSNPQLTIIKTPGGAIEEISRRGNNPSVYRRLPRSMQFSGRTDENGNGTGTLVSYKLDYILKNCQIQNNLVVHSQKMIKQNVVSHNKIEERAKDPIQFQKLLQTLYKEYLSEQITHNVIVFFTNETDQFLSENSKEKYSQFRTAYSKFIQIFIYMNPSISFAFVVKESTLHSIIADRNIRTVGILYEKEEYLKEMGYTVKRHTCPCYFEEFNNQEEMMSSNYSGSSINNIKDSNGYFMMPLLKQAFAKNNMQDADILSIISVMTQLYYKRDTNISNRIRRITNHELQVLTFTQVFDKLTKQLNTCRQYKQLV